MIGYNIITGHGTLINEGSLIGTVFDPGFFGSTLTVDTDFVNYGTIMGFNELIFDKSFINYGTILANAAVFLEFDTDTASLLADLTRISTRVVYGGTLDNVGQTLDLNSVAVAAYYGTLDGGTLTGFTSSSFNMVLNGVTAG